MGGFRSSGKGLVARNSLIISQEHPQATKPLLVGKAVTFFIDKVVAPVYGRNQYRDSGWFHLKKGTNKISESRPVIDPFLRTTLNNISSTKIIHHLALVS